MPSTREIQEHFGFASQTAAVSHLKALEKKGVIKRLEGKARGLMFTDSLDREPIVDMPIYGSIPAGFGDDTINGGDGNDIVVVAGYYSDFDISGTQDPITVTDLLGIQGSITLTASETIRFHDGDHPTAAGKTHVVTVQPIQVANDNGSNLAEYFGNAEEQARIQQMVDEIMFQAGIDIEWLEKTTWNNTFANVGDGGFRPSYDLDWVVDNGDVEGVGNSDPNVLDMYFVEVAAGFDDTGEDYVNGLAFLGYSGITMHVGDDMVSRESRRWTVASVVAHEICHNLGLDHVSDPGNLMNDGNVIADWQTFVMRNSPYAARI